MKRARILIIEDEMLIAYGVKSMLNSQYQCIGIAASFREAKDYLDDCDLALIDITLKEEKSGLEIAEYINEYTKIPFIFLTALSDAPTISKILELNPAAYLAKPVLEINLNTAIGLALHTKSSKFSLNIGLQDYKIDLHKIVFAKSEHVYTQLHFEDDEVLLLRISLSQLLKLFPKNTLQRINKSQAINPELITSSSKTKVVTDFGDFKISKTYFP